MLDTTEQHPYTQIVAEVIAAHGTSRSELIPILKDVNQKISYLPPEALDQISSTLKVSCNLVYSTASFYNMLSLEPRGRHTIKFCESAPCHIVGGEAFFEALKKNLDLETDQSSPDGRWTLTTTSCLGVCGVGPVIVIDEDIHGNLTPEQIPEILARYK
jgi:NADH-quinone oxidoreductase subunit E